MSLFSEQKAIFLKKKKKGLMRIFFLHFFIRVHSLGGTPKQRSPKCFYHGLF